MGERKRRKEGEAESRNVGIASVSKFQFCEDAGIEMPLRTLSHLVKAFF